MIDFIVDNAVWLAAAVAGVCIVAAIVICVVAGLRLWRGIKRVQRRVEEPLAGINESAARAQMRVDDLPRRGEELQEAAAELQARLTLVGVLATTAGDAADILRSPLRHLGR